MSETGHTRRNLLGAGIAVTTLSGCGLLDEKPPPPAVADPLRPLLDESLALAAAYDRAAAARPDLAARLTPLAADHRAHATELARLIGVAVPSGSAVPSGGALPSGGASASPGTLASLRATEQAAQRNAMTAAREAPAARVALVGSIAACRATHVEALR